LPGRRAALPGAATCSTGMPIAAVVSIIGLLVIGIVTSI
jgi:hypothetical protein